jgi:phosphate transport system protein
MREGFHEQLRQLTATLADMCGMAGQAMRQATRALLAADLPAAEQVLAADTELDRARDGCERSAQALLALQAPVAFDLRTILAAVYCAEKIERMGDLACHVASVARSAHPEHAVPAPLNGVFAELGDLVVSMAEQVQQHINDPAQAAFAELNTTDEQVDELHRDLMRDITADDCPYGVPAATNLALLSRFYERFADQAVSVAKRLDFAANRRLPD